MEMCSLEVLNTPGLKALTWDRDLLKLQLGWQQIALNPF